MIWLGKLAVLIGGLVVAGGLTWAGAQGLRGVPDSTGKRTSRTVAIVCLVLAALMAAGSVAVVIALKDLP
jgi:hypothetical protein